MLTDLLLIVHVIIRTVHRRRATQLTAIVKLYRINPHLVKLGWIELETSHLGVHQVRWVVQKVSITFIKVQLADLVITTGGVWVTASPPTTERQMQISKSLYQVLLLCFYFCFYIDLVFQP